METPTHKKEWPYSGLTKEQMISMIKRNLPRYKSQMKSLINVSDDMFAETLVDILAELGRQAKI